MLFESIVWPNYKLPFQFSFMLYEIIDQTSLVNVFFFWKINNQSLQMLFADVQRKTSRQECVAARVAAPIRSVHSAEAAFIIFQRALAAWTLVYLLTGVVQ